MIRVSASAFDVLWADLGHGAPPGPLELRSVGATEAERAEIRRDVYDNLAERGLFDAGALDEALESRLAVLASADVYVESEALADMTAESPFRAVAAARGRRAVLATQPDRTIGLSEIRESDLFSAIVDVLPELEPGPGYGVSLPSEVLSGVSGSRTGSYERQMREVHAIQARPVYSAGQFTVRVRDRDGLRRAGGVSWFSTDVGSYFGSIAPGRGGDWITVAPADAPRLTSRLASLLATDD
ncbi:ESX secretion-associated protein EspG [Amycolatopsis sp. NPDC059657]|uniref:ESX secretion-associated protein EspG n=1 Tax=Amycolatopsis sp. NPDC059657 TaxID=3346899 RepID=UPI00366EE2F3